MHEHEPLDRDWVEEGLIESLNWCKYDVRVECPMPDIKQCDECKFNPEAPITH